jgi:hypothetical protein
MSFSSDDRVSGFGQLGLLKAATLHDCARVHSNLPPCDFHGEEIQRPGRWAGQDFALHVEHGRVARALEMLPFLGPGDDAPQMGTYAVGSQKAALQVNEIELALAEGGY